ncbi:PaaI family thioesterase [Zavarzinia aquatilis]|uniref:Phenylacetic acid degradation protein n=1 Tax=Zavarzinia aquatilis TaxID=2211142 RepID=A0A317EEY5_9PROT|nr:PaaI family thioesterase [Zavarzinia aquatilis]PWR25489.1 phenylacetic acid degradation protein [Zavarzinia aquatilis]
MSLPAQAAMNAGEVQSFLEQVFEQAMHIKVEETAPGFSRCRLPFDTKHLRPGGTISGPSMFQLADCGLYAMVLGTLGPVALAVTTNLNINFLRKPGPRDMIAESRALKFGSRLVIGEVSLYSDGDPDLVAHATGTYSIPPR